MLKDTPKGHLVYIGLRDVMELDDQQKKQSILELVQPLCKRKGIAKRNQTGYSDEDGIVSERAF